MNFYIKQKVFSWGDKFRIFDENENDLYWCRGEVFTLGKKLHVCDTNDMELAFIHQKVWSLRPTFFIQRHGRDIATVVKKFTFVKPEYDIEEFGWHISGNFTGHEYSITKGEKTIATITKKWFTWGDTYQISVDDDEDYVDVLCVVLIIDAIVAQQNSSAD